MDRNASYIADIVRVLDEEIAMTAENSTAVSFYWDWADALHMGMNPYARLGNVTGDSKYHDQMFKMFSFAALPAGPYRFWNASAGLFYRDSSHKVKFPAIFWSRCQGWVMAALVSAIRFVPEAHPSHPVYVSIFKKMADSLVALQAGDGAWHSSLTQPAEFPPDSSGSAYIVFSLAFGVNTGLLDRREFLPAVQRGWSWLSTVAQQPSGLLGWCQTVGDGPDMQIYANSTSDFCVGMFLAAAAQVSRL
jgi:rhamnogalacturonyl hydrolase YesR